MAGVVLRAGQGEALFGGRIVIKASFDELCITESLFLDARLLNMHAPSSGFHDFLRRRS